MQQLFTSSFLYFDFINLSKLFKLSGWLNLYPNYEVKKSPTKNEMNSNWKSLPISTKITIKASFRMSTKIVHRFFFFFFSKTVIHKWPKATAHTHTYKRTATYFEYVAAVACFLGNQEKQTDRVFSLNSIYIWRHTLHTYISSVDHISWVCFFANCIKNSENNIIETTTTKKSIEILNGSRS